MFGVLFILGNYNDVIRGIYRTTTLQERGLVMNVRASSMLYNAAKSQEGIKRQKP